MKKMKKITVINNVYIKFNKKKEFGIVLMRNLHPIFFQSLINKIFAV